MRAFLLVLGLGTAVGAVTQDDFLGFVRKQTGISDFVLTTKRVCRCDGHLGWAVVSVPGPGLGAELTCVVPTWAADGQQVQESRCAGAEVLSR